MSVDDVAVHPEAVLYNIARDLHDEFRGVFSEQTISRFTTSRYAELARHATVNRWLAVGTERSVRQYLQMLVATQTRPTGHTPAILFLSEHSSGQSQIAATWLRHLSHGRAMAWAIGPSPTPALAGAIAAAMAEVGLDFYAAAPGDDIDQLTLAADAVITIGADDACTLLPGKHYEDWGLADPAGFTLAEARRMRDEIKDHVAHLSDEVGLSA